MLINQFDTYWFELSNSAYSSFSYLGTTYPTAEHAFQCQRVINPSNRMIVLASRTPAEAKLNAARYADNKEWGVVKVSIMRHILKAKFTSNPYLKQKLISTGRDLLEDGNAWGDKYWGTVDGVGENMLGKLLMELRDKINKGEV